LLSIGKLAADQAKYYLDHADMRVDVVDSVGGGLEEYYVGGREAAGTWLGDGAVRLRLEGVVEGDALRRVLSGAAPGDGSRFAIRQAQCASPGSI
jgi:conjugative relaxase-like TrwC/TraI family protein